VPRMWSSLSASRIVSNRPRLMDRLRYSSFFRRSAEDDPAIRFRASPLSQAFFPASPRSSAYLSRAMDWGFRPGFASQSSPVSVPVSISAGFCAGTCLPGVPLLPYPKSCWSFPHDWAASHTEVSPFSGADLLLTP